MVTDGVCAVPELLVATAHARAATHAVDLAHQLLHDAAVHARHDARRTALLLQHAMVLHSRGTALHLDDARVLEHVYHVWTHRYMK